MRKEVDLHSLDILGGALAALQHQFVIRPPNDEWNAARSRDQRFVRFKNVVGLRAAGVGRPS